MPPAARVSDMHVCPMVTVLVPHVGGPILPPGAPTVLVGFLPAATVTNMLTCVGPPDVILMGSTGVFINFLPAARMGDPTAHGGVIILGCPTVIIGEIGSPSPGAGGVGAVMAGIAATSSSPAIQSASTHQALLSFKALPGATVAAMPKKARMAYRKALIKAGRAKAKHMAPGPDKTALNQSCDRFERDNHAMEMANLSQAVYKDQGAPEGWTRLTDPDKLSSLPPDLQDPTLWNNPKTNYHAGLFMSDDGKIAMAERGTDPKSWADWKSNISQGWGSSSAQYNSGIDLAQAVKTDFPDSFTDLTGHSLGGGRAAAESAVTGIPATTFDAAGVNANTIAPYGGNLANAASGVQNYNVDGQILNDLKGKSLIGHAAPDPLGTDIPLPAVDPEGNPIPWPTPPPPAQQWWNPLQQGEHAAGVVKYQAKLISAKIDRHGIDKVQNALEQQKKADAASITHAIKKS